MNSICSHLGHFSQRFSGASLRETSALSLGRTKLVSQLLAAVSHEWQGRPRSTPSAPEDAERRHDLLGFLHLGEQFPRLVVGTELLCLGRFEAGDDGGLPGHLVGADGQDPPLAESRDSEAHKVSLAGVVGVPRRFPVTIGTEPNRIAWHVVADAAALAQSEYRARTAVAIAQLPDLGPVAAGLQRIGLVEQADDEFVAQVGAAEAERHRDQPTPLTHRAPPAVETRRTNQSALPSL